MVASEDPVGCSGLLRVAGLPVRYWLAGASPILFEKIRRLERDEEAHRPLAVQLAERIGQQLVPNPNLTRENRAFLLSVRRSLHRGGSIAKVSRERLLELSGLSAADMDLIQTLVVTVDRDRAIAKLSEEIEADLALEQNRLLLLPERIARESPVARALLAREDPDDLEIQSQPDRKSRRHRSEHEWRRIARAATVTTPRGWLSHVALLPITAGTRMPPPTVTEHFTAQWMENVRAQRLSLADPPDDWPSDVSPLTMNPLHWGQDGHFVAVALNDSHEQVRVSVRHTELLDAICAALAHGADTFGELAETLGCAEQQHEDWLVLRGFVRHLVVLGILQPSAPPKVQLALRAKPGQTFAHSTSVEGGREGWVDVYRYVETPLSGNVAQDVQRGVSQALRVLALMRDGRPGHSRWTVPTSQRTWSFTEILKAEFDDGNPSRSNREDLDRADSSSLPASSTSGYARLARALVNRARHTTELIIDSDLLDECGAATGELSWPVDCLVRVPEVGAGFTAVLDSLWPPGKLDARFADTLSEMHGSIPHVETYRAFLRRLEQVTGILFVELLVPPLSDGAANAVRRPIYTSAWTGDPNAAAYLRGDTVPGRYIPLDAIQLYRIEGRLRAEVDGQPIWPVYHATRTFEPPWDRLARVLLAAAPLDLPLDYERMNSELRLLPALLPEDSMVPRISVSGGIVLSPAQWRIASDLLWDRDAPLITKLRAMIRLRNRHSLPRTIYLIGADNKPPVPCDLESIHAIRTIERIATGSEPVTMIEMMPAPDQFLVIDRAHGSGDRLAAQLQLRLPCDESATALADRIAPAILAALDSRGLVPGGNTAPSGCRGPPATSDQRTADPRRTK